jgi:hypothetical protein
MCTGNEAGDGSARSEFGSGLRRCSRRTPSSTKADAADSCRFARRAPRRLLSVCSLTILLTIRAGTNTIASNFLSLQTHTLSHDSHQFLARFHTSAFPPRKVPPSISRSTRTRPELRRTNCLLAHKLPSHFTRQHHKPPHITTAKMRATRVLLKHTPMIKFLGRRTVPKRTLPPSARPRAQAHHPERRES